ncbi:phospholipase A1 PLIP1, chloroplastic-like [Coffea arabica]|uniref:Phospholipase A1 PLIP1, chloroplastic-like n=1 Tax=Coffea arabica TaxID=13443 RepID=A0ABM4UFT5_COFAR
MEENMVERDQGSEINVKDELKSANWVESITKLVRQWKQKQLKNDEYGKQDNDDGDEDGAGDLCKAEYDDDAADGSAKKKAGYFLRLLSPVPWSDTKLFSKLAFLCNMACVIPEIKAEDVRRYYGLKFVTSSLAKKANASAVKTKLDQNSSLVPLAASSICRISCRSIMQFYMPKENTKEDVVGTPRVHKSDTAAYLASSAAIAADAKQNREAAMDLESHHSSASEGFVCDDSEIYTRCFVIHGTDVLVHRGIYDESMGLYEQLMPEIIQHLERIGNQTKLQLTGHSLGGSLSLLVSLMPLTRKVVKPSALLPVVTFGYQKVLDQLGLDENNVHCVVMHKDIIPRAFSCNYPKHVKQLYSSMGKIFILQQDEISSPAHPSFPSGSALYELENAHGATTAGAHIRWKPLVTLQHMVLKVRFLGTRI